MTRGQEKSTAMLARMVWGRQVDVDEELVVLGELATSRTSVRALVGSPSSDRFEVTVRYLGDRRIHV